MLIANDIIDKGGNRVVNNDGCDGIFISQGSTCNLFSGLTDLNPNPTQSPSTVIPIAVLPVTGEPTLALIPSTLPNSPVSSPSMSTNSCRAILTGREDCINIYDFKGFKKEVVSSWGDLILCPFNIDHPDDEDALYVLRKISIICKERHMCIINGPRTHLRVKGDNAELYLQGFKFQGGRRTAVLIKSTPLKQTLCGCMFSE
jgi:hypothetical protein